MNHKWIEVQKDNHIASVALNKVESLNALSYELATEITDTFNELASDNETWVIILSSNARIFTSGLDLKDAMSHGLIGRSIKDLLEAPTKDKNYFECCHAIEECKKPVIAAVHSMCIGAGLNIVSACDLRLCTQDATFSLREPRIGIVPDMGALQRLPLIIGQMYTRQMAYTGRFFSSSEVEKMGLVIEVLPDKQSMMDSARKMAEEILESAPLAVQSTKEVLNFSRFAPVRDAIAMAVHKNMLLMQSNDCREAMTAFAQKRNPQFRGA